MLKRFAKEESFFAGDVLTKSLESDGQILVLEEGQGYVKHPKLEKQAIWTDIGTVTWRGERPRVS